MKYFLVAMFLFGVWSMFLFGVWYYDPASSQRAAVHQKQFSYFVDSMALRISEINKDICKWLTEHTPKG